MGVFDRRKHARGETSIEAQLFLRGDQPKLIPCSIVDLSQGGVKIQLEVSLPLPSRVFLLTDGGENLYECEAVWQDEQSAGLMFVDLYARAKRQQLLEEIATAELVDKSQDQNHRFSGRA